ncbi:MAG: phosphate ABC transporter substrate-binding protein [Anaeromyxobacteraceae bacterium]|nr:phosphate ABC transporter substrate-binding protein [Anaeromyxobacteraceae bacterium]
MNTRTSAVALLVALLLAPAAAAAAEEVRYSGSSTIGQSILQMAGARRAFEAKSGVKFGALEVPGSGKGIEALLSDKANVAGASRPLKADEKAKGVVATVIGYDAVAVFVNVDNPVDKLTRAQLKGIFTGAIKNWKEVGGKDAPIAVNTEIQGAKRATMEMFNELVMDKAPYGAGFKEIDLPKDQIVEIAKDPNGIGTPSLGLLAAVSKDLRAKVKAVAVDGVAPTDEAVRTGAYPVSRPLNLATKGPPAGAVKTFIEYMLTPEGQAFVEKDFVGVGKR